MLERGIQEIKIFRHPSPARFARFIPCYSLGLRCKHEKAVSAWWSPSISNAHLDKLKLADKVVEHCRTFDSIDSS